MFYRSGIVLTYYMYKVTPLGSNDLDKPAFHEFIPILG